MSNYSIDPSIYHCYTREQWQNFHNPDESITPIHHLAKLVSLNDRLSQEDATAIYAPMLQYIDLEWRNYLELEARRTQFFHNRQPKGTRPFIIGISGSVAVGKSTTARVLSKMLQSFYHQASVKMMTTDGFLYPQRILEARGIEKRKGFPESYNMSKLIDFMVAMKTSDEPVEYPVYSHELYDIVPGETHVMTPPDILIVEGINVLQLPENQKIYVSDFFDLSIYVDAEAYNIEKWYMERFELLIEMNKDDPTNYYYQFGQMPRQQALNYARETWLTVNMINLVQNIEPTRQRADIIIHKTKNHYIDHVYIRKY